MTLDEEVPAYQCVGRGSSYRRSMHTHTHTHTHIHINTNIHSHKYLRVVFSVRQKWDGKAKQVHNIMSAHKEQTIAWSTRISRHFQYWRIYFAKLFSQNTYYGIEMLCPAPFQPVDSGQHFARRTVLCYLWILLHWEKVFSPLPW